jgi:hypothetical protein
MNERLVRICKTTRSNTQRLFLQNKRVTLPTKTKTLLLQFDLATSSTSTNCIKCRAIVLNRFFFFCILSHITLYFSVNVYYFVDNTNQQFISLSQTPKTNVARKMSANMFIYRPNYKNKPNV